MSLFPEHMVYAKICGALLTLTVEVKDVEDYGAWNHLLLSKHTATMNCGDAIPVSGEVHISWSQVPKPLPFAEGQTFEARVTAKCELGGGIDESFTTFWASYWVWTCDATSIEVINE